MLSPVLVAHHGRHPYGVLTGDSSVEANVWRVWYGYRYQTPASFSAGVHAVFRIGPSWIQDSPVRGFAKTSAPASCVCWRCAIRASYGGCRSATIRRSARVFDAFSHLRTFARVSDALTDIASTAFTLHVKRDVMGDVVAIGNAAGVPTPTETYGYNALYRLTGMMAANGTSIEAYTYNKTGDRLSKAPPGLSTGTYDYASGTHHLMGIGTTTRQVDARGNTTVDVLASGTFGYGYNSRNRLAVLHDNGATVGSYVLNALGQRVQKVAGGLTTRFDYDGSGQLLGESTGTTARDYVWMEGLPVGVVDRSGSAATVNFIHADGLGSTRVVTDTSGTGASEVRCS